ncbi:BolA family transcriptional regulator [Motiliproteus sp. MSK22-1]|uniref:BolA family protein n=1 Tax=Motiliproteus sp. MSK22-1 TaxID=1897630 RepID=UPI000977D0F4|nr:BolA family protein [Motiliproteus sp. MSK22-1]OMH25594.1 transcriptional regulator [Motiliproteus sp. MSK22-1]
MQAVIEKKLNNGLSIEQLSIVNESHMHAGPATDSHFKLTVVSEDFAGKRPVARHQVIYGLLADELAGPVHALVLHLFTPEEWEAKNQVVPDSPKCSGNR